MLETDADRSWQAGHGEPWTSKRDEQGRSNARHSCLVTALHSNLEDLEEHVLAHSSERANSDSEGEAFISGRYKNGSTVFMLISSKTKRDFFCVQNSMVTCQQQSTKSSAKDVNVGTITDTLSWYKFSPPSGIRAKPKLHRRRRRIYESSFCRRRCRKFFIWMIYENWAILWRIIMESSNNYTLSLRNKRNCRPSCTSSKTRDVSRIIAIWIGW